ncbi:uncharacterized protein LOC111048979 isoform X3 [Nilaparvata lugens]|nr:uncharacterized protein LOC111048979 isoform X3 [Nilaparvata lugens]
MRLFFQHSKNNFESDKDIDGLTLALRTLSTTFRNTLLKNDFQCQFLNETVVEIIAVAIQLKNNAFDTEVSRCLQQLLFTAPAHHDYLAAMTDASNFENSAAIVKRILKFPKTNDPEVVAYFYPHFLSLFAKHKGNKDYTFDMFQILATVIGYKPLEGHKNNSVKVCKGFKGNSTMLEMLTTLKDLNISLDREVDKALVSKWLSDSLKSYSSADEVPEKIEQLKLFKELLFFVDPIVIEQMFPNFVSNVMLSYKTSDDLRAIYCQTLTEIFHVFEKLSRVNKFISKMLDVIIDEKVKKGLHIPLCDIFPEEFCRAFDKAVTTQPIGASVSCLAALRWHFENVLLPKLEKEPINDDQEVFIDVVFCLTTHLLSNMCIVDDSVSTIVQEKFSDFFDQLAVYLQRFGKALLTHDFNIRATKAFFKLSYTWGALNLLLIAYKFEGKDLIVEQTNGSAPNLSYVLRYLSESEWQSLAARVLESNDDEIKSSLFKLMIQKIGALRSKNRYEPAVETARFLLDNAGPSWLCENSSSLLFFLEKSELLQLSNKLLKCKNQDNLIALLKKDEFQENSNMVAAMSIAILWKIAGKLKKSGPSNLKNILLKLDLEMIIGDETDHKVNEDMTGVLENLAKILSEGLAESPDQLCIVTSHIEKLIELLSILPLSYVKNNTQCGILFCLFDIVHCLEYNAVLFELIANILDSDDTIRFPANLDWHILIHSVFTRAEKCPFRNALIECLIKAASCSSANIKKIVSSLSSSASEESIIISTIISQVLPKIMRNKRNFDGASKNSFQQCENEIRNCLSNVSNMKPELRWLPSFGAAIHYHVKPNCEVDANEVKKLSKLIPQYLDLMLNNITSTEASTESDLEKEGSFLELILSNRKHFEFDLPNDMGPLWTKLAGRLPVQKLQSILQLVNIDQFSCILATLKDITSSLLKKTEMTEDVFLLWRVLVIAQLSSKKEVLRKTAVNHLSDVLLQLTFVWKKSGLIMNVHELLIAFAAAVQVEMTSDHVGMCLEVVNATPVDARPEVLGRAVDLLSHLLRYRSALMLDHIPQLFQQMSHLIAIVCRSSHLSNIKYPAKQLAAVAFSIEKLANVMVTDHKRHFSRVAHHFLANVLRNFEEWTVEYTVKVHLLNVIFSFLSLCDQHTISFLMRCLPTTPQHMFKDIRDQYKKYHAFTGRV